MPPFSPSFPFVLRALRALFSRSRRARATPVPAARAGLATCPRCAADMVCPMEWHEIDDERWSMWLRCGQCGFAREEVATNEQADELDGVLRAHRAMIERALAELVT